MFKPTSVYFMDIPQDQIQVNILINSVTDLKKIDSKKIHVVQKE